VNRLAGAAFACALSTPPATLAVQDSLQIGIIDFYGLGTVSEADARRALAFTEGDEMVSGGDPSARVVAESRRRLTMLAGVGDAKISLICCDQGRLIIYVGIENPGAVRETYRDAPRASVRLRDDVVQAGREFGDALMSAVRSGDVSEDDSQGHALAHDPAMRAIQERFIAFAARDLESLLLVLNTSDDAEHRALAAQVLGYVANKQRVVADLASAMRDSVANVRNNAMRTLAVFASMAAVNGQPKVRVPYEPFVSLLHSLEWTDRNKALFAVVELSERRDSELLATLRRDAMEPLVEMARWKSRGHAMAALIILGRIAGLDDGDVEHAWASGERERIIRAAVAR